MRKGSVVVALAVSILVGIGTVGAGASGISPAKKRCHFVKKKVHGKIKRVRVCTKPKPKPKPKVKNVSISVGASHSLRVDATGTTYGDTSKPELQLAIPQGALASQTEIAISRVTAVRGLPKGLKLVAGVQLEPENLALEKPATLVVKASGANLHAIAWFGRGRSVSRHPSTRVAGGIQIKVAHFSGVAVVQGAGWTVFQDATAALRARFNAEIKPRLAAAASEDPLTSGTFEAAFAWERQVQLLGLGEVFAAEWDQIVDALEKSLVAAIGRSETACKSGHDLSQIERLTKLGRVAGLWGIQVPGDDAFQRAVECAHFELDGTYRITADYHIHNDNGSCVEDQVRQFELGVELKGVPLALSGGGGAIAGDAPVVVTKYAYTETVDTLCTGSPPFHCAINGISAASEQNVQLKLEIDTEGGATRGHPLVTLTITPGSVRQTYSNCFGGPPAGGPTDIFTAFATDQGLPPTTSYVVSLSEPPQGHFVGGDVYATYGPETVEGTASVQHYTMTRSFTLRHAPAP